MTTLDWKLSNQGIIEYYISDLIKGVWKNNNHIFYTSPLFSDAQK